MKEIGKSKYKWLREQEKVKQDRVADHEGLIFM